MAVASRLVCHDAYSLKWKFLRASVTYSALPKHILYKVDLIYNEALCCYWVCHEKVEVLLLMDALYIQAYIDYCIMRNKKQCTLFAYSCHECPANLCVSYLVYIFSIFLQTVYTASITSIYSLLITVLQ